MKDFRARCKGSKQQGGFSLLEILVVVAILAILTIIALFSYQRHMMRVRDVQRKTDLDNIRFAFEEYYNDHRCYPEGTTLYYCGSSDLSPYLKEVPCDPLTRMPYGVDYLGGEICKGFRILTTLEIKDDTDIEAVGCDPDTGCPSAPGDIFNYGVAVGAGVGDGPAWNGNIYDDGKWYCIEDQSEDGKRVFSCSSLEYENVIGNYSCTTGFENATDCTNVCPEDEYVEGVTCDPWGQW